MIRTYNNLVMVENKEDFEKNWDESWERLDHSTLFIKGIGYIDNENKSQLTFPLFLYYAEPWDSHCVGTYRLSTKEDFASALQVSMNELEVSYTKRKELLKFLLNTI